jgi:acetyl esterase/lipase
MASDELTFILDMMGGAPPSGSGVEERRADLEATTGTLAPPTGTEIELVELDDFDAEWIHGPDVGDEGALLYLHGGGYCIGSIATHRALASRLSVASGLPVLLPGYRLAPEHPFPAGLDDALAAYGWLVDRGFAPDRLAVAGDSAGGGLTLATLLRLRDGSGVDLPSAAALLSPWADLTLSGASMSDNATTDPMVTEADLDDYAAWYAGDADRAGPLLSPAFADLAGLPPLLIQVGEPETLLDDAKATAATAEAAGVDVTLDVWPEVFHVWQASAGMTPEGDRAVAEIGAFLAGHVTR